MKKLHLYLLGRLLITITLACVMSVSSLGGISNVGASAISTEVQRKESNEGAFQLESQIYDDTDTAWAYTGSWSGYNARRAYGGQIHLSSALEDQATILVTASSFTLIYSTASNYGTLDVYVDGQKIQTINQQKSRVSHQNKWLSPEFASESHVLKFVHVSGKGVNIDAIKVRRANTSPSPTPTGGASNTETPTTIPTEVPSSGNNPLPTSTVSPEPTLSLPPSSTSTLNAVPTQTQTSSPTASPTLSAVTSPTGTATMIPSPTLTSFPSATQSSGNVYYSGPTGSGTTCSMSTPCSLSAGLSKLAAGDTLYLKSGVYLQSSKLSISQSGTANARITIMRGPLETGPVVISGDVNGNGIVDQTDGPRTADPVTYHQWTPLLAISGSYLTVKNIEIAFSGGRGVQSGGANNVLSGLNVHHTWDNAIYVYGPYTLVEKNRIWRGAESNYCGGVGGKRRCNGNWSAGLAWGATGDSTAPGSAHHITVRGNTVYNNSGEGIICMHADYGVVENNVVYDNWGPGIDIDKCAYETVQNNLIYYTADTSWWRTTDTSGNPIRPAGGILISNEDVGTSGDAYPLGHDRKIINNMIVGTGTGITFWPGNGTGGEYDHSRLINDLIAHNSLIEAQNNGTGIRIYAPPLSGLGHTNTRITDNLILQSGGTLAEVDTATGLAFDHNLWSRIPPSNVSSPTDVVGDPKLVDPNHTRLPASVMADWYRLTSSSPAINAGVFQPLVMYDYFGTSRSDPPDMGAHEYSLTP